MSELKNRYRDKLEWLEMGIPFIENPEGNPNSMVFTLAMPWRHAEPIIKELEAQNTRLTSRGFEDLHHENEQLKAQIDAVEELANKFEEVGGEFGDIAAEWVYQELREVINAP